MSYSSFVNNPEFLRSQTIESSLVADVVIANANAVGVRLITTTDPAVEKRIQLSRGVWLVSHSAILAVPAGTKSQLENLEVYIANSAGTRLTNIIYTNLSSQNLTDTTVSFVNSAMVVVDANTEIVLRCEYVNPIFAGSTFTPSFVSASCSLTAKCLTTFD